MGPLDKSQKAQQARNDLQLPGLLPYFHPLLVRSNDPLPPALQETPLPVPLREGLDLCLPSQRPLSPHQYFLIDELFDPPCQVWHEM